MQIRFGGIVQGVGFRPFIFRLARRYRITGLVRNDGRGVLVDAEGAEADLMQFMEAAKTCCPANAVIQDLTATRLEPVGYKDFFIVPSVTSGSMDTLISPDIATCDECLKELFDARNRRYAYPFINCTNCGPRFTIVRTAPYDRDNTTMAPFVMCPECEAEYTSPSQRRFHAQPNACDRCGPHIELYDLTGTARAVVPAGHGPASQYGGPLATRREALALTVQLLHQGEIVAIKGLGGYHMSCDAAAEEAVRKLRKNKFREDRPFALMGRDLKEIHRCCEVGPAEEALLLSGARPIVLLRKREPNGVAPSVAPGYTTFGCMLPYTPLHHLLLQQGPPLLVMTSGNISEEPIAYRDDDVFRRLARITPYFLTHDRPIARRCDDSVVRVVQGKTFFIRRSRGYAPAPLLLSESIPRPILGLGAQAKNTFCIVKENQAFLSHHIGDLDYAETFRSYTEGLDDVRRLFALEPDVIAYDLHPRYVLTQYAHTLQKEGADRRRRFFRIQHHRAHIASCIAEHGLGDEKVIGIAFDGTGFGDDGRLWGGEFFAGGVGSLERAGHLRYVPLVGGESAIRAPWKMAYAYLNDTFGREAWTMTLPNLPHRHCAQAGVLRDMIAKDINSPLTSSCGRLFDAFSSILGLRHTVTYEGQAAVELEMCADPDVRESFPFSLSEDNAGMLELDLRPAVRGVIEERKKSGTAFLAGKFHATLAEASCNLCQRIRRMRGIGKVVLSGGVFQNMLLLERLTALLEECGFAVFVHRLLPANDASISLGQCILAHEEIKKCA